MYELREKEASDIVVENGLLILRHAREAHVFDKCMRRRNGGAM